MRIVKEEQKSFSIQKAVPYIVLGVLVIIAVLAVVFALRGTSEPNESVVEKPDSEYRNYYSSTQIARGGEALNDVSIYDVNVTQEKDDLVIELQFSYNYSSTEGNIVQTKLVPTYELYALPQPHRLCLNLENVTQWEFTGKTSWLDYEMLQGIFVAQPTYESSDNPTVIFHLTDDCAFRVEEDEGTLRIFIRQIETEKQGYYHVLLNGLSEYASYKEVRALGLTPTLCEDANNTLLISEGFASEEDAQSLIDEANEVIASFLPGKSAFIQYLEPETLPVFPEDLQMQEIENMPVLYRDGSVQKAEVLEVNANVLASSPAGDSILCYSPVYSLDMATGESIYSEILYLSNETDTYEKLVDLEFAMILYAQYSPDGRYVGFLDYNSETSETSLYCYDLQLQQLLHISEEDFGTFVYDFAWDPSCTALYAVTLNEDGTMCIRSYDFESPDGQHVTVLHDLYSSEGMVGATMDSIFYADTDSAGENAAIYRMDKLTGESEYICDGERFVIDPTESLLAAETPDGFKIIDIDTKEVVAHLDEAVNASDFRFSANGNKLFLVVDTGDTTNTYPSDVYIYDVEEKEFSFCFSTAWIDLEWSLEANCLLVNTTYYTQTGYIPVTYRIRL